MSRVRKAIYPSVVEQEYAQALVGCRMKRVGEVVRTAQGLAIARCSDREVPDIGASVLDESLDTAGRIVDVFGPVERPYVAVSPRSGVVVDTMLGTKLYTR